MAFDDSPMLGLATTWRPGGFDFWDALWMGGGGVLLAVALATFLARPRRRVEARVFRRLLHRVQGQRETRFAASPGARCPARRRAHFLRAARERLRACAFFRGEENP